MKGPGVGGGGGGERGLAARASPGSRLEICLSQTTTEAYSVIMPSCGPTMC